MVDLGAEVNISRFVVEHAGAGGESFNLNTAAFNIQVSTDGVNFSTVVNVTGNVASITTHDINPTTARFVQLNITTPTQTADTNTRIYEFQVFGISPGSSADFSFSAVPASQSVVGGFTATYTTTSLAMLGFNGTVALSASGLPQGVTASFNPPSVNGMGDANALIATSTTTPQGTYQITLTGTSGSLQHSVQVTLVVNQGNGQVNLASLYNKYGMVTDNTVFATGGLDGLGFAYSANLLGSSQTFGGASFAFGPPNVQNAVSSLTIPLQPCQCPTLSMLGTAVNGSQASQTFTVKYTDGTTSTFTQGLSDWHTPANYPGESHAVIMTYRDKYDGTKETEAIYLYAYSFALNAAKTVSSLTLPSNTNVNLLALTLNPVGAAPDFSLSATPSSQTVTAGNSTSYTATVAALNGFSGNVTLTATGLPTGATATFSPNPLTPGTSTVGISTTSSTPSGGYTITLTGTSGSLVHSTTFMLNVSSIPDFSVSVTPPSQSVTVGSAATYTATVTPLNGFTGSVTLSASGLPTGATASFSPNPLSSGTSSISVSTAASTPTGSFTITVTGTSGALQHSVTTTLVVNVVVSGNGQQVNLSAAFNKLAMVNDGTTFTGGLDGQGFAYSATLLGGAQSFGGSLFNLGSPNVSNAVANTTVTLPAGQFSALSMLGTGVNGNQTAKVFTVKYTDGTTSTFTQSFSDWFSPQNYAGETVAVAMPYRDQSNGTKDPRTFNLYGYSFALNPAKTVSTLVFPTNPNVNVLAITLTSAGASPDFSISATPPTQTVTVGNSTSYTAAITALNGFNGSVTLSATGLPTGATATYTPNPLSSGSSTVGISTTSATPAGSYTVTITGTSGSLVHSTTVTLNVADFSISATPSSQPVAIGGSVNYMATVTPLDGFTGSVTLSSTGLPTGATATYTPNPLSSGTSTVKISTSTSTPAGSYTITITGTSGISLHSANVTLNVSDFSISATPSSQTVMVGGGTSYTATVTPLSGFSGSVILSATGLPTGATATYTPNPLSSGTSTVAISTSSTTPAGSYTITITGTSGSLTHSTTVTLNVADFSISATPPSQTVAPGGSAGYTATVTPLNGFSGSVTLVATGLPTGATATYTPNPLSSGASTVNISTSSATPANSYTITLTGTSGGLQHATTFTLVVSGSGGGTGGPVNLSSVYNKTGIVLDGTTFVGGLDGQGFAYSETLLGTSVNFNSLTFTLANPNGLNAVSNKTIPLPAGQYSSLAMLATGVNGSQPSQTFTVTYSDGTSSSFVQSLSDWHNIQNYSGESPAVTMAYRNSNNGTKDNRTFYLYGYSFPLNGAKTVSSLIMPSNGNVAILAVTLSPIGAAPDFAMSASPAAQSTTVGNGATYMVSVNTIDGFSGSVALNATGLPAGALVGFNPSPVSGSGNSTLTVTTSSSVTPGVYPVTITGTSGALQHSINVMLTINPATVLASAYNRLGIANDGTPFTGGLDQQGFAYSYNLLGPAVTFNAISYTLGLSNAPDCVSGGTVTLPAGQFSTLALLATSVNGNHTSQAFKVTYTDGTSTSFTQSLSDWHTPQSYAGESQAVTMAYRDSSIGGQQAEAIYLYAYAFTLNPAKTVSSVTLPNNSNVVALAITLVP
jgi:hypothetical protein